MIGSGKYDFPGIRKTARAAVTALIAGTAWGSWILSTPLKLLVDKALEWLAEYLANKGLVLINVGVFYVAGKFDQDAFDSAMDAGLEKAKVPGLTDEQKRAIDEEVKKAFRRFGRINVNDRMPNDANL